MNQEPKHRKNSFLVSGEPGSGKSYFIKQEAKNHKAKLFRWNVRIDRSLREGREILHQQVRSLEPLYVWIEGADDLTQEAQAFLRRILETASKNVISMLEVREPWKMSPPILSRCIPICMNIQHSLRYERNLQIAKQNQLIIHLPVIDNPSIKDIPLLRKLGYDPILLIHEYAKKNGWTEDTIEVLKNIGSGFSPWVQLSYILQKDAVCSKTKEHMK